MRYYLGIAAAVLAFAVAPLRAAPTSAPVNPPDSVLRALNVPPGGLDSLRAAGWPRHDNGDGSSWDDGNGWNRPEERRYRERFSWFWMLPREWRWAVYTSMVHPQGHWEWRWGPFAGWYRVWVNDWDSHPRYGGRDSHWNWNPDMGHRPGGDRQNGHDRGRQHGPRNHR